MTRTIPLILFCLISGCASLKDADAPGCHGPRRPANPYGSVLLADPADPSRPASTGSADTPGCGRRGQ